MTDRLRGPIPKETTEAASDAVSDDQGRASGSRPASRFYEPLPIGSDAFATPLAPTTTSSEAPGPLRARAVWLIVAAAFGVASVALGLAMGLKADPALPASAPLSRVERPPSLEPVVAGHTVLPPEASDQAQAPAADLPGATLEPAAVSEGQAHVEGVPGKASVPSNSADSTPRTDHAPAHTPASAHSSTAHAHARSGNRQVLEQPDRAQVIAAMSAVQPEATACFGAAHGTATANIRILGSSGRVTTAQVTGQPGAIGSCIARAVRRARFPKFTTESLTISYPFGR